jgi:hypothetical protein
MTKTGRRGRPATPAPQAVRSRRPVLLASGVLLAAAVVAAGGYWWSQARQPDPLQAFQTLQGRWQRTDGGYIIDIRSVDATGKMRAAYYNPRPINVAKAEASLDGGQVKVFLELRDVNYPGSTYTLTYDPAGDRLAGIYFQAVERSTFEVAFTRMAAGTQ